MNSFIALNQRQFHDLYKQVIRNYMYLSFLVLANLYIFSSPGRSPGRAIVLPAVSTLASALASALANSLTLKFFMRWARRCQASYPVPVTGLVYSAIKRDFSFDELPQISKSVL